MNNQFLVATSNEMSTRFDHWSIWVQKLECSMTVLTYMIKYKFNSTILCEYRILKLIRLSLWETKRWLKILTYLQFLKNV